MKLFNVSFLSILLVLGVLSAHAEDTDFNGDETTVDAKLDFDMEEGFHIDIEADNELDREIAEKAVKIVEYSLKSIPASIRGEMSDEDKLKLEQAIAEIEALAEEKDREAEELDKMAEEIDREAFLKKHQVIHEIHPNQSGVIISNDRRGRNIDWTGFLAVLLIFGGPIIIIAVVSYNRRKKREMVHNTIDRMIDKGQEVPVEMLDALDKGNGNKPTFHKALVNIALGLGLGVFLLNLAGSNVASLALIPLFIGLAQLVIVKLEKNERKSNGFD